MLFMHNFKHRKCHPLLDPTVDPSIKYVWPQISTSWLLLLSQNGWRERQKRDDSQSCRGTDDAMCLDLNHIQSSVASHLQTLQMRLWFVHVGKQEIFTLNDQWLVGRANTGFWFMTANYSQFLSVHLHLSRSGGNLFWSGESLSLHWSGKLKDDVSC